MGRNASQMLTLLLEQPKNVRNGDIRRISLQHFLNEILSTCSDNKAIKVFFGMKQIDSLLSQN